MDEDKLNVISEADDVEEPPPSTKKLKLDTIVEEKEVKPTADVVDTPAELLDFMHNLGEANVKPPADVYQTIAAAADDWAGRILDAESLRERSPSFRSVIYKSIQRLEIDGFLSLPEANELRYIADMWVQLLQLLSAYKGEHCVKKNIISLMIALYDLKQLNAEILRNCLMIL